MCGITGFYSTEKNFDQLDLELMTQQVAHRGPDAEGIFFDGICGLGHRRLSILDLSTSANQPMLSHNERYIMVFNGEVYNFKDIANELKISYPTSQTNQFKTSSDTEVILEAFSQYGHDFVHKLNGMFAIAIYDKLNQELFIYRDRLGIKPLYYHWDGVNFVFASELKSIVALKKIVKKIDKQAVISFLHVGYIPGKKSIYQNIFKLPGGSFIKLFRNNISIEKYWDVEDKIKKERVTSEKQAMVQLSDLLISSVQYQLISDVPVGVFLSGGIDSSLIATQAVNLSSVKVNTFSIGFKENQFNESEYARAIAKYLGTNHYEFIVSSMEAQALVDSIIDTYDEPFSDSSAIPTMLVSKLARKSVTVTLSGEGGDELFMGYGTYQWARRLDNIAVKLFRKPLAALIKNRTEDKYFKAKNLLNYSSERNLKSHIFSQEQFMFSELEIECLLTSEFKNDLKVGEDIGMSFDFDSSIIHKRRLTAMEEQALFDLKYYLQDDLLTKVDRASMQFSLETRVPYLDHRIVEYALNISQSLKIKGDVSKYILKQILYQYIPPKYFNRPKQGFAIPLKEWLKKDLRFLIEDNLNEDVINEAGIVKYEEVKKMISRYLGKEDYLYNRIWLLILLHKWYIKNK